MLSIFDVVLEPAIDDPTIEVAKSEPWIFGYVIIGLLVGAAVFFVIRLIKTKNKK